MEAETSTLSSTENLNNPPSESEEQRAMDRDSSFSSILSFRKLPSISSGDLVTQCVVCSPRKGKDSQAQTTENRENSSASKFLKTGFERQNRRDLTLDTEENSSLSSVSISQSRASFRIEQLMAEAENADGSIDHERLVELFKKQRKSFRKRLEAEKSKRKALEELLMRNIAGGKQLEESREILSSSVSRRTSSSSKDTGDLLLDLVQHLLRKQMRSSAKTSSESTPIPTLREEPDPTPTPDKENFYKSTSLFTLPPPHPPLTEDMLRLRLVDLEESSVHIEEVPEKTLVPIAPPRRTLTRKEEERRTKEPSRAKKKGYQSDWWWVPAAGEPTVAMPHSLHECLKAKRHRFIVNVEERKEKIAAASYLRKQLRKEERELAEDVVLGRRTMEEVNAIMAARQDLAEPTAFPRREMVENSKRKYYRLPELLERQRQLRLQFDRATYRVAAQMYHQKIQYRLMLKNNISRR